MTAVLTVSQARKRFGTTQALGGVDLELRSGEWLALLGPNGAGKTTLVRALGGRVRLDEGRMEVLGRTLDGTSEDAGPRSRIGIVPQDIALYPKLTAGENLEAWGRLHGVAPADLAERTAWALDWTGLVERSDEPIERFSGGMKRRLNLACAVLHRPEIVLLDEPTVGVDPQSRERIWHMLDEIRSNGASLLLTTHQLDEAQQVCDRIVIIDHGRAIAAGTFEELLEQTIGSQRRVTCGVERREDLRAPGPSWQVSDDGSLVRTVDDIAAELPLLLAELSRAGYSVNALEVESPSLQAVFLHLTGRELRE